jgi:transcription elongation factor GreA
MVKDRTVRLTPAGKRKLQEELQHLLDVKKPSLATRIQESTEHGDVSDNSEYEDLKEEFVLTEARIQELEQTLERAEIVDHPRTSNEVGFGSSVTIRGDDDLTETWTLVSPEEADTREGTISTESPVGQVLLGRKVGDSATVRTPGGSIVYTVIKID